MNFVTAGHLFASSRASASVMRRHVLPPNPSESEIVIFLAPHHEGAAAVPATPAPTVAARPNPAATPASPASLSLKLIVQSSIRSICPADESTGRVAHQKPSALGRTSHLRCWPPFPARLQAEDAAAALPTIREDLVADPAPGDVVDRDATGDRAGLDQVLDPGVLARRE